jgi:aminoglycoside phosphotransferase (APT) family kinase protein
VLESELPRAIAAASSVASSLGLTAVPVEAIVLQNSNKLSLRLRPADVLARVAPSADRIAWFEVDLAQRLAGPGSPVAALDPRVEPRVHERDGYVITLWTYYAPIAQPVIAPAARAPGAPAVSPADYADALQRLHARMRAADAPTPHFTDRVGQALRLVDDRELTPELGHADRALLGDTLRTMRRLITERGAPEQLLHGEPHPGNLLNTTSGLIFIDLETCCRGPVEFDLGHAPEEVADHYPGIDHDLLRDCRTLVLAINTMWRWDRDDQLPDRLRLAGEWLDQIRARTS